VCDTEGEGTATELRFWWAYWMCLCQGPKVVLQNLRKSGQGKKEKFAHGWDVTELYIVACWCSGLLWSVLSGTVWASGLLHAYCSTNDMYNRVAVRNLWIPKW